MRRVRLGILTLLLTQGILFADANRAGGVFLTIFPGARPSALGAAYSAIADDGTASYYNPGALGFIDHTEVLLVHAPWLRALAPDMYYEFSGFTYPLGNMGTLGGHVIYLTLGEVVAYEEGGTEIGRFRPYDVAVDLAYGLALNEKLGVGIGWKYIYSFLAPGNIVRRITGEPGGGGSAMSFAFDAGLLYKLTPELRFAAVLTNMGPGLKYTESGEEDPLPYTLRLGAAWTLIHTKFHRLTFSADINKVLVNLTYDLEQEGLGYVLEDGWYHIGVEYEYYNMLAFRVGYFYDEIGARVGPTFGAGVRFKNFRFDFADDSYIYEFLERNNRRFSISYILKG